MSRSRPGPRIPAQPAGEIDDFERAKKALSLENIARHPRLREAVGTFRKKELEAARKLIEDFLDDYPRDVRALQILAQIAAAQGHNADAEALLEQCVKVAPDFVPSRYFYANLLMGLTKPGAALLQADELARLEPRNPLFRARRATILEKIGNYAAAAEIWRGLIEEYPSRPDSWERYGNALRALGRLDDAIKAYRKLIEFDPLSGSAWWHLADIKTFRFDADDANRMESALATGGLETNARAYLHFSLGKAYADLKLYEKSFVHYAKGNAIRRGSVSHDPGIQAAYVSRCKEAMTADFFRDRAGFGCASQAPIFLVGMMRAGSTLVEQILASHSRIEGTGELADLSTISRQLQNADSREGHNYPAVLGRLDAPALIALGERYLSGAGAHRKLDRPFFTDKMGANFAHTGLIQLVLPNARIVDVRRHPMACCFSNFAQIFPQGQNNAYRLADIGHYYRNYVELMAHFDRVLPGRVHRVFYEDLVREPEREVRRLLAYLDLPFEQDCLRFYDTARAVTTVSSEQVRKPIYRDALEQWKDYEPWLGPLKAALGPVLEVYPAVPDFGQA